MNAAFHAWEAGRVVQARDLLDRQRPVTRSLVPDLRFTDLSAGRERCFSECAGKPVVLEFWASTCGPCQVPMVRFETVYQRHPTWRGRVEFISMSLDHEWETVRREFAEPDLDAAGFRVVGAFGFHAPAPGAIVTMNLRAVEFHVLDETAIQQAGVVPGGFVQHCRVVVGNEVLPGGEQTVSMRNARCRCPRVTRNSTSFAPSSRRARNQASGHGEYSVNPTGAASGELREEAWLALRA